MRDSGLAGIGKFVMRNRQYLGCLRVRGSTLIARAAALRRRGRPARRRVPTRLPAVAKRELDLALQLIEGFTGPWKPERYEDTYTKALRKVVQAKLKGREVHAAAEPEEETPALMEALRRSVDEAKRPVRKSRARPARRRRPSR